MDFENQGQAAGRRIGYLRVSTAEQRPDRQIDGLTDLCDELHVEILSAVKDVRPVFDAVVARLTPGDTLVVWDLDRAFRSTRDALTVSETLEQKGIALDIVRMRLDTSRPEGMLMYTIMAAVGEFERQTLARRTREGLDAARRRGVRLGRPPKLTDDQVAAILAELETGAATVKALAERYGVAPWTLTRSIRRTRRPQR
ncbi:recombinase family protein [Roseospira visakhapatnamensis]|uniref:DNA invertase Pin-like site-specific DNA recombinase n=1 Tax=Roseospira visakhapatnamensis TaxID=390880 RepID=A0A7W6RHE4_9PROT|nr:recombinase family protein [Roseospira visakhapatnamensis]MBB4267913.1 DNA invertase Pin-like site-specific DNA recombinase [Roseospira visakhapatnamensis]